MARVVDQRDRAVRHMADQGVDSGVRGHLYLWRHQCKSGTMNAQLVTYEIGQ